MTADPDRHRGPTTLIQPQMAIGYPMLSVGATQTPLSNYLNVPYPGWTPTPNPSATTGQRQLQVYWQLRRPGRRCGPSKGHEGSAAPVP